MPVLVKGKDTENLRVFEQKYQKGASFDFWLDIAIVV